MDNYNILVNAINAGDEVTKDHDPDNWFPCGSGSVLIKPRNSKFAKWLLDNEEALNLEFPSVDIHNAGYKKAIIIRPQQFKQAMVPQIQWSETVAQTLIAHGVKATTWSYID